MRWQTLLRPGDYFVMMAAVMFCLVSAFLLWRGGAPEKAMVRSGGRIVAEVSLSHAQHLEVSGRLGITVIEIEPGRARVQSDPGPHQYCVRQGWLSHAGATAICAPNEVSLSLSGRGADYDSLSY